MDFQRINGLVQQVEEGSLEGKILVSNDGNEDRWFGRILFFFGILFQ